MTCVICHTGDLAVCEACAAGLRLADLDNDAAIVMGDR